MKRNLQLVIALLPLPVSSMFVPMLYVCMYVFMYFTLLCFRSNCRHDRPESEVEKYVEKMTDLEEKYEVIHFASHCVYYHTYSEQTLFIEKISTT